MNPRLEERLVLLRQRFLLSLEQRYERFRRAVVALETGDLQARNEIRMVAHQLAGVGSSYGLPQFTEWGRDVEARFERATLSELREDANALGRMIAATEPVRATAV